MVHVWLRRYLTRPSVNRSLGGGRQDAQCWAGLSPELSGRYALFERDRREREDVIRTISDSELDGGRSAADGAERWVWVRERGRGGSGGGWRVAKPRLVGI